MVRKIPDDILETLFCDVCYKFLSVKPVKVFTGKKTKCGRCSTNDPDKGVVSLYESIADQFHFPCVNRYEGCEELLTPSQVPDHEKICQSSNHVCPICQTNEEIPTFLMVRHFRESHKKSLLKNPFFNVLIKSVEIEKCFLFETKNRLFFINFSVYGCGNIALSARHLGVCKESENLTQQFVLNYSGLSIETGETECYPHGENNKIILKTDMFNIQQTITVCFQINIRRILFSDLPVSKRYQERTPPPKKNASLIDWQKSFLEKDLIRSRIIFLDKYMGQPYLSVDSTYEYLIHNSTKMSIFLQCIQCGELSYSSIVFKKQWTDYIDMFQEREKGTANLICYSCRRFLKVKCSPFDVSSVITQVITVRYFSSILLSCVWYCHQQSFANDLLRHEIFCEKQPTRLCPVQSCPIKGKLFEIEQHLKDHSPRYFFYYTSFAEVDLDSSMTHKLFFMVRNAFVSVELTWRQSVWNMKFSLCGEQDTFAGMKLKAFVMDSEENDFLKFGEYPQEIQFHHMKTVHIKCFLNKEEFSLKLKNYE